MMKMEAGTRLQFPLLLLVIIVSSSSWLQADAERTDSPSPPKFKQDILRERIALVDDSPKFVCRARGQPMPYITWYRNNELLSINERIKITHYSLQISNLKMTDSGKYSCKVKNDHGEIWGNFTLTVYEAYEAEEDMVPPIYGEMSEDEYSDLKGPPVFSEGNLGGYIARAVTASVEMDCSARSYPKASITWWRDGRNEITASESKYVLEDYKLEILSLTLEDKGEYKCIVSNEYGNISLTYTLEVQQRVAIAPMMEDVQNQTATEGENVTFTCKIVMSDSHPLLQWLRHYMVNDSFTNEKGEPYVKKLQQTGYLRTVDDPQELVLTNVTKEDEGWYTCFVANTVGMNYRSAWLEVLTGTDSSFPPKFKQDILSNKLALVNDSHKFECGARGQPKPYITWYRNNELLPKNERIKITKYSLQISNLKMTDSGKYSCRVKNDHGEIWGNFTLTVYEAEEIDSSFPPKFKQDIFPNKLALVDDSYKFECRARGQPKPYITWYRNNELLPKNERIKIAKYSLQISNLKMTDSGKYSCRVKNYRGEIWGNFTLTVYEAEEDVGPPIYGEKYEDEYSHLNGPPVFSEGNLGGYIARAATASVELDCSARSYPKASITWWRDGHNKITASESKYVLEDYKLEILSLTLQDKGEYRCIVSNEFGNISHTYTLEVQRTDSPSPPKFKQDILPEKIALVDDSPKFVCRARGQPRPYITWYRNNELLPINERIKITKYSLQISNLKMTDSGKYSCKVKNAHGEIWGNFTLTVYEAEEDVVPPTYGEKSEDEYSDLKGPPVFNEGNLGGYIARAATASVELDCSARSYPKASITWWRDGRNKITASESKYVMEDHKLEILSLTLEDKGEYKCIVSNEYGNISHTYTLEVQPRVAIAPMMEDVQNQTATEGENVTFTCKLVMSDSHPLLQWLRHYKVNDSFTNEKGEPYVKKLQQTGYLRSIDDPQELVLTNVTQEDEDWYTCFVANTVGMNYRSAWLEVLNETETVAHRAKNKVRATDASMN